MYVYLLSLDVVSYCLVLCSILSDCLCYFALLSCVSLVFAFLYKFPFPFSFPVPEWNEFDKRGGIGFFQD